MRRCISLTNLGFSNLHPGIDCWTQKTSDVGNSIFEYGQTYVALSRVKSLQGLYLSAFEPEKIQTNPLVIKFYKSISSLEETK